MSEPNCLGCKHWRLTYPHKVAKRSDTGTCHRYAPRPEVRERRTDLYAVWPVTLG